MLGDRGRQSGLLRQWHEPRCIEQTERRMLPPDEGLDAGELARAQVQRRLVVQQDRVGVQRRTQLRRERQPLRVVRVRRRVVDGERPTAALRLVHRDVGVLEECRDRRAVPRVQRDADARVDRQRKLLDDDRRIECRMNAPGGLVAVPQLIAAQQHGELVAAKARDRVGSPEYRLQARRDFAQKLIPRRVAERVVDLLEAVEVEQHHRDRLPFAFRSPQRQLHAILEEATIGKPGQAVVQRVELAVVEL